MSDKPEVSKLQAMLDASRALNKAEMRFKDAREAYDAARKAYDDACTALALDEEARRSGPSADGGS